MDQEVDENYIGFPKKSLFRSVGPFEPKSDGLSQVWIHFKWFS